MYCGEWISRNRQSARSYARQASRATLRPGQGIAPVMHLVKTAEEPDQHQNRNRYSKQPQKQITSHRRFSLLQRELDTLGQVPDTLVQRESWNQCTDCGLTLAMGNERSKWRNNV